MVAYVGISMIDPVDHIAPSYIHPDLRGMIYHVTDIHIDPRNTKIHGPKSIAAIAASLSFFGQTKPIIVRASSGVIIAGNGTYQAATGTLDWDYIACVMNDCSEVEAKAIAIADNRSSEKGSSYHSEELLVQLEEIKNDTSIDVSKIGWPDLDMEKIRAQITPPDNEEGDSIPGYKPSFGTPIMLTMDQRAVFDRGREKILEETGSPAMEMSDGRVVELIVADYLAGA